MIRLNNQIELRHLSYFVALADCLHFGRAAENLLISQSSLSQQIAKLEGFLNAKLFERDNRNVRLTETGELFKEEAIQVIVQFNTAIERWKLMNEGFKGLLKIGFVGSAMEGFLPPLIAKLTKENSDIKLQFDELSNARQLQALSQGKLDVGLVRSNVVPFDLESKKVYQEHFCLLLPKSHHLAKGNFRSLAQMASELFILFPNDNSQAFYSKIIKMCEANGFYPKISHRSIHGPAIHMLVEMGQGISIVPKSLVDVGNTNILSIELKDDTYYTELFAVWSKTRSNRVLDCFLEHLPEVI